MSKNVYRDKGNSDSWNMTEKADRAEKMQKKEHKPEDKVERAK